MCTVRKAIPGKKVKLWSKAVTAVKSLSALEYLLLGFGSWAVLQASIWFYDQVTAPLVVQNTASQFAADLRAIQGLAGQRHEFLTVRMVPMSANHPAFYEVHAGQELISSRQLPPGVSGAGSVKFDPQGVPVVPSAFIFSKRRQCLKVKIDNQGLVLVEAGL